MGELEGILKQWESVEADDRNKQLVACTLETNKRVTRETQPWKPVLCELPAPTCLEGRVPAFLSHVGLSPLIFFHDLPPSEL